MVSSPAKPDLRKTRVGFDSGLKEEGGDAEALDVIQRFVTLGEARGDFIEVISGVKEGDEVASTGLLKLRSGQPVTIDNTLRPEPSLTPAPPQG